MNKKFLSSILSVAVVAGMSFNVYAASVEGLANADPVTVPIVKSLHADSIDTKYLENFTFNFTAIEVTDVPQAAQGHVTMPTIPSVTINSSEWATATNETLSNGFAINKVINKASGNVVFKEVGKYLYKITEAETESGSVEGDSAEYYVLFDVYKGTGNKLAVQQAIYNKDPRTAGATKTQAKFNNTVTCNEDIYIEKQVTGAKGDTTKDFSFTVTLSDTNNHAYVVQEKNGATWTNTATTGTVTGGTANFTLKHNQRIWIKGLTVGSTYSITENLGTDRLVYTTNIDVVLATAGADVTNDVVVNGVKVMPTTGTDTNSVVFTNNRENVVNTGIVLDMAPYALFVVIASGALVVTTKAKKAKSDK